MTSMRSSQINLQVVDFIFNNLFQDVFDFFISFLLLTWEVLVLANLNKLL